MDFLDPTCSVDSTCLYIPPTRAVDFPPGAGRLRAMMNRFMMPFLLNTPAGLGYGKIERSSLEFYVGDEIDLL